MLRLPPRSWFQLQLSTCIAAMFLTAPLVYVNTIPGLRPGTDRVVYGWPFICYELKSLQNSTTIEPLGLFLNLVVLAAFLVTTAVLVEFYRQHGKVMRKAIGLGVPNQARLRVHRSTWIVFCVCLLFVIGAWIKHDPLNSWWPVFTAVGFGAICIGLVLAVTVLAEAIARYRSGRNLMPPPESDQDVVRSD